MTTVGFLRVSAISDGNIKKIAEASNTETKNDTIDTKSEWRSLLSGIAKAFGAGEITYDTAKKYVDLSSSIFTQKDRVNNAYKNGFAEGLAFTHGMTGSRIARKIQNFINPNAITENIILTAENSELNEKIAMPYEELVNLQK